MTKKKVAGGFQKRMATSKLDCEDNNQQPPMTGAQWSTTLWDWCTEKKIPLGLDYWHQQSSKINTRDEYSFQEGS